MVNKKHILVILLLITVFFAKAQNIKSNHEKNFYIGISKGFGNVAVTSFNVNGKELDISEDLSNFIFLGFDVGYHVTDEAFLSTGIWFNGISLNFEQDNKEYSYNGPRLTLPLIFNYKLGSNSGPIQPILGVGPYYSFAPKGYKLKRSEVDFSGAPFKNLGLTGEFGMKYHEKGGNTSLSLTISSASDFYGNNLDLVQFYVSAQYAVYLF